MLEIYLAVLRDSRCTSVNEALIVIAHLQNMPEYLVQITWFAIATFQHFGISLKSLNPIPNFWTKTERILTDRQSPSGAAHCVPCNTFGEQREIYGWIRLFRGALFFYQGGAFFFSSGGRCFYFKGALFGPWKKHSKIQGGLSPPEQKMHS